MSGISPEQAAREWCARLLMSPEQADEFEAAYVEYIEDRPALSYPDLPPYTPAEFADAYGYPVFLPRTTPTGGDAA